MDKRLTKPEYGCYLALAAASRSEDPHTQTGCILFDENWRTVGTGFNGFPPSYVPDSSIFEDREKKSNYIIHAEVNALMNSTRKARYLCTVLSPCVSCAKTIVGSGVKHVYYLKEYTSGSTGKKDELFKGLFDLYSIKYEELNKESLSKIFKALNKSSKLIESFFYANGQQI